MPEQLHNTDHNRGWFRYSLRGLLLLVLLIAVYLGGWASHRWEQSAPPLEGQWTANLPAGFRKPVSLQSLGDGQYMLQSGGVFSGVYEWQRDRLVVVKPNDERMKGLTWKWNGEALVLVAEPPDTPTGPSYLGATLKKAADGE